MCDVCDMFVCDVCVCDVCVSVHVRMDGDDILMYMPFVYATGDGCAEFPHRLSRVYQEDSVNAPSSISVVRLRGQIASIARIVSRRERRIDRYMERWITGYKYPENTTGWDGCSIDVTRLTTRRKRLSFSPFASLSLYLPFCISVSVFLSLSVVCKSASTSFCL